MQTVTGCDLGGAGVGANAPPVFFLPENSFLGYCRVNKKNIF